jgi:hypothetical protein
LKPCQHDSTAHTGTKDFTFKRFKSAAKASFEHQKNDHKDCGSWCQANSWTEEEEVKFKTKYREKVRNAKEYSQQLVVKEVLLNNKIETMVP